MSKSREWVIHRPDWQTQRQRAVLGGLTLVFWIAWFYLWLPAISFIAWIFGLQVFYVQIFEFEGYRAVLALLGAYGLVVLVMGGSLVGWAIYNWLRFRGVERRKTREYVTIEKLSADMGLAADNLQNWQACRRLIAHHDHHGRLTAVDCEGDPNPRQAMGFRASGWPPA
ncbi:MAG: poly-beta-1,6-N-acetyl-D-glucosamine biosynthesis protein PgaD [Rhodocyclaceae bacterium]|nr:poly-beta-1,6-N-acetyl-D-glucosamine biosynthesis protein PgaD [Rhodocyclaceae bacterium]HNQ56947.1 poly-beta-1,6-N-acetyl-D-glucosamine biosynthesis protein PgaD [Candidatus Desulfobacillus denitrificans]HNT62859.1 poly-beta-1,6-N-acetyl-D-glucosamine biosynthesis protein PgaD [Candidatus Desulfobacillus denitrificans]